MNKSHELANRFREVLLYGKWIANTNFQELLAGTNWKTATQKIGSLNTLALLAQHVHYYVAGVLNVFEGGTLDIRDQYSFDFEPITSQQDWEERLTIFFNDAEQLAKHIAQLSSEQLADVFENEKYGSYQRNIEGLIEHAYYHMGQVSLIKKMIENNLAE